MYYVLTIFNYLKSLIFGLNLLYIFCPYFKPLDSLFFSCDLPTFHATFFSLLPYFYFFKFLILLHHFVTTITSVHCTSIQLPPLHLLSLSLLFIPLYFFLLFPWLEPAPWLISLNHLYTIFFTTSTHSLSSNPLMKPLSTFFSQLSLKCAPLQASSSPLKNADPLFWTLFLQRICTSSGLVLKGRSFVP